MAKEPEKTERRENPQAAENPRESSAGSEVPPDPGLPEGAMEVGPGVISIRSGQDPAAHGGRSPGGSETTAKDEPPRSSSPGHRER